MGRRKIKKTDTTLISFKVETNSLENRWLNAQENRTQSLKYLIQLAKHQFGNKDLVELGLKASLDNPDLTLSSNGSTTTPNKTTDSSIANKEESDVNADFTTKDTNDKNETVSKQEDQEIKTNTNDSNVQPKPKGTSKRMIRKNTKAKDDKNSNTSYGDQLRNSDDMPDIPGLE